MERGDLLTGIVLGFFGLVMWGVILLEKYTTIKNDRFPKKGNEALHKWFEEQRRKKFKP